MEDIVLNKDNYCFDKVLSIPLILNQIFGFLDRDSIKYLSLSNKKIYEIYCNQVNILKIKKEAEISNIEVLINKYNNINNLDLSEYENIKDFTLISK